MVTGVSKTYIIIKYFVLGHCAFRKLIFELNTERGKSEKPLYATNATYYLSEREMDFHVLE